jgi:hypothetical protein
VKQQKNLTYSSSNTRHSRREVLSAPTSPLLCAAAAAPAIGESDAGSGGRGGCNAPSAEVVRADRPLTAPPASIALRAGAPPRVGDEGVVNEEVEEVVAATAAGSIESETKIRRVRWRIFSSSSLQPMRSQATERVLCGRDTIRRERREQVI